MNDKSKRIFTTDLLRQIFPPEKSDIFFEALFGDKDEGAYDIELAFVEATPSTLNFEFQLHQRPGRCLACNLTSGLPQVFSRHPIINIEGLSKELVKALKSDHSIQEWQIGRTRQHSSSLHAIPLTISVN